jgi:hypothetical protein
MFSNFSLNCRVCEVIWQNIVEPGRPQVTMWQVRFACWIPEATNTHSEYVRLIAVALSRLNVTLYEHCLSFLRYLNRLLQQVFNDGVTALVGQGLPLSRIHDHTQVHHTRENTSGRVISPTQSPLPDNTRKRQTSMPPGGIGTHNPSKRAAADPRLIDRAATGTGIAAL